MIYITIQRLNRFPNATHYLKVNGIHSRTILDIQQVLYAVDKSKLVVILVVYHHPDFGLILIDV